MTLDHTDQTDQTQDPLAAHQQATALLESLEHAMHSITNDRGQISAVRFQTHSIRDAYRHIIAQMEDAGTRLQQLTAPA